MHRVIWLSVGGKKLHLIKLAGAFIVIAGILMVAQSAYNLFLTVDKILYVQTIIDDQQRSFYISQLFGWSTAAPYSFTKEDVIGVLLAPIAGFLFWLGLTVVAIMVYQSGKVILPIEEYEQKIREHHKGLIEKAVRHKRR